MSPEADNLFKELRKAEGEFLALRDAKSNGTCIGMSLYEILEYDEKVEQAARRVTDIRNEYLDALGRY